jgi:hypothetical protein
MLMHSPTHAFSLLPYERPFFDGWDNNGFTYTWIRDQILLPRQNFYRSISLSLSEQEHLLHSFALYLPKELAFKIAQGVQIEHEVSVKEFAQGILRVLPHNAMILDALDSFLYQALPLTPGLKWKESVYSLLEEKTGKEVLPLLEHFPDEPSSYMAARVIKEIAKAFYVLLRGSVCLDFDLHEYITNKAEKLLLSSPSPLIFADSNWSQNYFGFVVSPITEELQLWRMSESGYEGIFLRSWAPYLSEGSKQVWSIYTRPQEYSQLFERKI